MRDHLMEWKRFSFCLFGERMHYCILSLSIMDPIAIWTQGARISNPTHIHPYPYPRFLVYMATTPSPSPIYNFSKTCLTRTPVEPGLADSMATKASTTFCLTEIGIDSKYWGSVWFLGVDGFVGGLRRMEPRIETVRVGEKAKDDDDDDSRGGGGGGILKACGFFLRVGCEALSVDPPFEKSQESVAEREREPAFSKSCSTSLDGCWWWGWG